MGVLLIAPRWRYMAARWKVRDGGIYMIVIGYTLITLLNMSLITLMERYHGAPLLMLIGTHCPHWSSAPSFQSTYIHSLQVGETIQEGSV